MLSPSEWHRQADRDWRAAQHLLDGGFGAHATVMAHLAVEKALKGRFADREGTTPPVTHDLRYLAERLDLAETTGWTADLQEALDTLSDVSIVSLYAPDRPFGHPVSDRSEAARERVAAAGVLLAWLGQE